MDLHSAETQPKTWEALHLAGMRAGIDQARALKLHKYHKPKMSAYCTFRTSHLH